MVMSLGQADFKRKFEISPIYLTRGIAGSVPGATVPLISYLETSGSLTGLTADDGNSLDNAFAHFFPIPGGTLANNAVGQYPFANQSVAANAIIFEPLHISLLMRCPARAPGDYNNRQAILSSLQRTLKTHALAGGTFSIATPAYLYVDCLFLRMTDASSGETHQAQFQYQLDFYQPLVTEEAAMQSYNNLMAKAGSQTRASADADGRINWSGAGNTVNNPGSGAAPGVVPSTRTDPGLGFAPSGGLSSGGGLQSGTLLPGSSSSNGPGFAWNADPVAFNLEPTPQTANSGADTTPSTVGIPSVSF